MSKQWIFLTIIALIIGSIVLTIHYLIRHSKYRKKNYQKYKFADDHAFIEWKKKISTHCDSNNLVAFSYFLTDQYKGSKIIVRTNSETNLEHEDEVRVYSHRELSDLKGIFLNVVVKTKSLTILEKENFRRTLIDLGVKGVQERPNYELRDGKLRLDRNLENNQAVRKKVGNDGENKIREILRPLRDQGFKVINGLKLRLGDEVVEIDHLVISHTGIFVLETKAFGLSENKEEQECRLELVDQEQWLLYKKSTKNKKKAYWVKREVPNPSSQIQRQRNFFNNLFKGKYSNYIYYAIVLANSKISIEKTYEPQYDLVQIQELDQYLNQHCCRLSEDQIKMILLRIDNHRIN